MESFGENFKVKLCGVQGCCPELSFDKEGVRIADDFGSAVFLTAAQWQDLAGRIQRNELPEAVA